MTTLFFSKHSSYISITQGDNENSSFALITAWICDICVWKTREIKYYVLPVRYAVSAIIYWLQLISTLGPFLLWYLQLTQGPDIIASAARQGLMALAFPKYLINLERMWFSILIYLYKKSFFFLGATYFTTSISIRFRQEATNLLLP